MRILSLLFISTLHLSSETYISNSIITNSTIEAKNNSNISHSIISNSKIENSTIGISVNTTPSQMKSKKSTIHKNFSQINLNVPAKFMINNRHHKKSIEIKIEEQFIDSINFYVKNNQLYVNSSKDIVSSQPITITINNTDDLNALSSSAATQIKINELNGRYFNLNLTGISNIKCNKGKLEELIINSKGNHKIDFKKVSTNKATIKAKGIGKIKLKVNDFIDATLSGIVKVYYSGNPKVKKSLDNLSRLKKR